VLYLQHIYALVIFICHAIAIAVWAAIQFFWSCLFWTLVIFICHTITISIGAAKKFH
jgi:hypothetical protein